MKSLIKKITISHLSYSALICILFFFSLVSFKLFNLYMWVNSDVFQYIDDGRAYLSFTLPVTVHAPPGNPLLIGIFSFFFQSRPFPGIFTAKLINVISVFFSLGLCYFFGKKIVGKVASLLLVSFLAFHPLTLFIGVNASSEPLFIVTYLCSIYLFSNKKHNLAYLLAGVSYLIRTEGSLLIFLYSFFVFFEIFKKSKKQNKDFILLFLENRGIFYALFIFFFWNTVIFFANNDAGKVPLNNVFLGEIVERKYDLPELRHITNFLYLFSTTSTRLWEDPKLPILILGSTILILIGYLGFINKNKTISILSLFTLFYIIIHTFFPAYDIRYLLPVLFNFSILFVVFIYQLFGKKYFFIIISAFFLFYYPKHFFWDKTNHEFFEGYSTFRIERRLVSEWIESNLDIFSETLNIIHPSSFELTFYLPSWKYYVYPDDKSNFSPIYNPEALSIQIKGHTLNFVETNYYNDCMDLRCVAWQLKTSEDFVIVFNNETGRHSIGHIQISEEDLKCLNFLHRIDYKNRFAEIATFNYQNCPVPK